MGNGLYTSQLIMLKLLNNICTFGLLLVNGSLVQTTNLLWALSYPVMLIKSLGALPTTATGATSTLKEDFPLFLTLKHRASPRLPRLRKMKENLVIKKTNFILQNRDRGRHDFTQPKSTLACYRCEDGG